MRGRFCTQPFLVEKQTRYPLSPRRFPSPAPLGESIAPSSAPVCALGHLPPKGKALGVGRTLPVCETTPPSPPSRGAGRYGRGTNGPQARQKKRGPPQGPPNQSRESRGENLSPLALFPPVSREKRGPRRVGALRGAAPRGTGKAPTTRRVRSTAPLTGAGREPPK